MGLVVLIRIRIRVRIRVRVWLGLRLGLGLGRHGGARCSVFRAQELAERSSVNCQYFHIGLGLRQSGMKSNPV